MATVYVTGKVIGLLGDKGFRMVEEVKTDKWESKNYFTVWAKELPAVDAEVKVKGSLSVKLQEYQGKQQVQVTINAREVSVTTAQVSVPSVSEELPF